MPLWLQNLAVAIAVLACVAFIAWQAYRALQGKKSKLAGCGTCKSCGTEDVKKPAAQGDQRVAIIPLEMLARRHK
jgi:cytochrome c553